MLKTLFLATLAKSMASEVCQVCMPSVDCEGPVQSHPVAREGAG